MFNKILIANRGEIACRIAQTCRELGVTTVAVYSDADAEAAHVAACDEAWRLGPPAPRESYLNQDAILEVARRSGAEAVHPGYGFLAENAGFARACEEAGIAFIGPPPSAIEAMGSKTAAKQLMAEAGVPLIPGYHEANQDPEHLAAEAEAIGYPVLIKASAGGGGKGMRRVDHPAEFREALAAAQREASASFGDDQVLIEKYVLEPRHVEIQVFADRFGDVVHLYERDCSVQRRHQKILEEAPAPGLTAERRAEMGEAACRAAQAIGYQGAGTVEFIVDAGGGFYFMEMNTRLQVEHPVTEMVTGEDLVAWQLEVAAGGPLPRRQEEITLSGHAIEARVCAEDPAADFRPATGRIRLFQPPRTSSQVRLDTGVRSGDRISPHYDSMVAKLIVWDRDRPRALARLRGALDDFQVAGLTTNIGFLRGVAGHPSFIAGDFDTGFVDQHGEALLEREAQIPETVLAAACLLELLRIEREAQEQAQASGDPYSPWHASDGWRLNGDNHHTLELIADSGPLQVTAHYRRDGYELALPSGRSRVSGTLDAEGRLALTRDGVRQPIPFIAHDGELEITWQGRRYRLRPHDPLTAGMDDEGVDGSLTAPMPGTLVAVRVEPGQKVQAGETLAVLEAMKMEYTIEAPSDGTIAAVHFAAGDTVDEGTELLVIE